MRRGYDAIVIGLGGMGSAAAYHLAKRGLRVLGLDAFARGHGRGSSHGRSRIIREAYYEAPEYVPLVQRGYGLWRRLEEESGRALLRITGGLSIGRPDSNVVTGVIASAKRHGLVCEELSPADVAERFPGFRLTHDLVAVFQPNSGILDPEACNEAHLDLASQYGAEFLHGERVLSWAADGEGVRVDTDRQTYRADRAVIAVGAWSGELLADLQLPLSAQRVVNVHFEPTRPELFAPDRCPVHSWQVPEGHYYGVPALPDQGVKFGRHDANEECTPETVHRQVDPQEIEALRKVLDRYLPGAAGATKWTITCIYPNSIDRHFIIDRHPRHSQVVYGCGFSGHGFKFASVVGEILADLAQDGHTRHPIGFIAAARFASPAVVA
ncbi:MAG: sarcosine oxidase [Thermomicrobiales bacterium]|nr:sarcosine oxidase [Thermomicrobiales bacterium]MEA2582488.1 sarcosine oxidase [Thermomicrobiales bacterium]